MGCAPGLYRPSNSTVCIPCPMGTYQDNFSAWVNSLTFWPAKYASRLLKLSRRVPSNEPLRHGTNKSIWTLRNRFVHLCNRSIDGPTCLLSIDIVFKPPTVQVWSEEFFKERDLIDTFWRFGQVWIWITRPLLIVWRWKLQQNILHVLLYRTR